MSDKSVLSGLTGNVMLSINKGSENEFTLGKMTFAEFILKDIDIQEVE